MGIEEGKKFPQSVFATHTLAHQCEDIVIGDRFFLDYIYSSMVVVWGAGTRS